MHKIIHTIYAVTIIAAAVVVLGVLCVGALIVCTAYDAYQIYTLCR